MKMGCYAQAVRLGLMTSARRACEGRAGSVSMEFYAASTERDYARARERQRERERGNEAHHSYEQTEAL